MVDLVVRRADYTLLAQFGTQNAYKCVYGTWSQDFNLPYACSIRIVRERKESICRFFSRGLSRRSLEQVDFHQFADPCGQSRTGHETRGASLHRQTGKGESTIGLMFENEAA